MNSIRRHLVCVVAIVSAGSLGNAQTADALVAQGRAFLAKQDLANANARFSAAVAADPNHQAANALYGVTRVLVLPDQLAVKAFLDRLGLSQTNRSIYHWNPTVPKDTNGAPLAPAGVNANEAVTILRTDVLPEITAAAANLAMVSNTNFVLNLTSNETTTADVTVDYGDIQLLRAGLHAAEYLGYTLNSQNWDAQLTEIRSLYTNKATTVEQVLAQYPNLLTYATTNDLQAAKVAFENAVDRYLAAAAWIQSRPIGPVRLFNPITDDPQLAKTELDFRQSMTDLRAALDGPIMLTTDHNYTFDLRPAFAGTNTWRSFLPTFQDNAIILGTISDPTFGGLVAGLSTNSLAEYLGNHFGSPSYPSPSTWRRLKEKWSGRFVMLPHFANVRRFPDGHAEFQLASLDSRVYKLEASMDLEHWRSLGNYCGNTGVLSFSDPGAIRAETLYYRASEATNSSFAERAVITGTSASLMAPGPSVAAGGGGPNPSTNQLWWSWTAPVSGSAGLSTDRTIFFNSVTVYTGSSVSNLTQVASTNRSGELDFPVVAGTTYHIVSSSTYSPFGGNIMLTLGLPPPNDAFANRIALTGTNLTVSANNVAATVEPNEPAYPSAQTGASVWWSWTAPASGSLTVTLDSKFYNPYVAVFSGDSLANVVPLAAVRRGWQATLGRETTVDVQAGMSYPIVVAGANGGTGPFTLRLSFTPGRYPLVVSMQPLNGGTVNLNPPPGADGFYALGEVVSLAVTPAPGLRFTSWTGDASGSSNTAALVMNGGRSVVVNFKPTNDDFTDRIPLDGTNVTTFGTWAGASREQDEPKDTLYGGAASVWWSWTSDRDGYVLVTVNPRQTWQPVFLAVYTGTQLATLQRVAASTGNYGSAARQLAFPVKLGTTYEIAVAGWDLSPSTDPTASEFELQLAFVPPLTITVTTPANGASFSAPANIPISAEVIDAIGTVSRVDYYANGTLFGTAFSFPYAFTWTNISAGAYSLSARATDNSGATAQTGQVLIQVQPTPPPVIATQPVSQKAVAGGSATFSIAVSGIGPFTYQWQFNGSNLPNDTISTLAGRPSLGDNGPATNATVLLPGAVAIDFSGNLYIADTGYNRIRKVDTHGVITTVAGNGHADLLANSIPAINAVLYAPEGVVADALGNIFFSDSNGALVRKVDSKGILTTVAGGGADEPGDGGPAINARLHQPRGLALNSAGSLLIADGSGNRVRMVDARGIITTVAGNGSPGFTGDGGPAVNASLDQPTGIASDASGNLYVADSSNNRVRRVHPNGIIVTVAGGGTNSPANGGVATSARLLNPSGVAVDNKGDLIVACSFGDRIWRVSTDGRIAAVAGGGTQDPGDGGAATDATLHYPGGIALDPTTGDLLVADTYDNRIRKVSTNGIILTIVGGWIGDNLPATNANLFSPRGIAVSAAGDVLIADVRNNRIRQVDINGVITTLAGGGTISPGDGLWATNAALDWPMDVAVSSSGDVFIAESPKGVVRKVDTKGIITTVAGSWSQGFFGDGGSAIKARLTLPTDVFANPKGELWISDIANGRVRKVDTNGVISTVAGNGILQYFGDNGPAISASLNAPVGITMDVAGNLFIADRANHRIRKVDPSGLITTVAGGGNGGDGNAAITAELTSPEAITLNRFGDLLFTDGNRIRQVDSRGVITTIVGGGTLGFSGDGGAATNASLNYPDGVTVDGTGNLYIADSFNNCIRKVAFAGSPLLTLNPVNPSNAGDYRVIVTSPFGSVTSLVAVLTVVAGPPTVQQTPINPGSASASLLSGARSSRIDQQALVPRTQPAVGKRRLRTRDDPK